MPKPCLNRLTSVFRLFQTGLAECHSGSAFSFLSRSVFAILPSLSLAATAAPDAAGANSPAAQPGAGAALVGRRVMATFRDEEGVEQWYPGTQPAVIDSGI